MPEKLLDTDRDSKNQRRAEVALDLAIGLLGPWPDGENAARMMAAESVREIAAHFRSHRHDEKNSPSLKGVYARNLRIRDLARRLAREIEQEASESFLVDQMLPLYRLSHPREDFDPESLERLARGADEQSQEIARVRKDLDKPDRGGKRSNLWLGLYGSALRALVRDCCLRYAENNHDVHDAGAGMKGNLQRFCVAVFEYAMAGSRAPDRTINNQIRAILPDLKKLDAASRAKMTHFRHAEQLTRMGRDKAAAAATARYEEAARYEAKIKGKLFLGPVLHSRRNRS